MTNDSFADLGQQAYLGQELMKLWEDQRAFNLMLRKPPTDMTEMAEQARDFVLYTEDELHELLRCMAWKKHRRKDMLENAAHRREEGIDAFKCVISLLQIIGIHSLEELIEEYWRKTAVVKHRYREEWQAQISVCVIVDIDGVVCDYRTGMCEWICASAVEPDLADAAKRCVTEQKYVNAINLGISHDRWQRMKHAFRVDGVKRRLPVYNDAPNFLARMRASGVPIVMLTSRPIDQYPNIFSDTIFWLNANQLPFDYVWWSHDKGERIAQIEGLKQRILFAVDDELRFCEQFASAGIRTFWLNRARVGGGAPVALDRINEINTLYDVPTKE